MLNRGMAKHIKCRGKMKPSIESNLNLFLSSNFHLLSLKQLIHRCQPIERRQIRVSRIVSTPKALFHEISC